MQKRGVAALAALGLLLGGCGLSEAWEDFAGRRDETPLERVLAGADDTPGNQSLLYTAMAEAEAAAQSADRALGLADNVDEVKSAIGEVLYAIAPEAAPERRVMQTGILPSRAGKGYGVRRAVDEMAEALRAVARQGPAGEPAALALICVENTRARTDQVIELTRRALAITEPVALVALLPELEALTDRLNDGHDADENGEISFETGECGLQQAAEALQAIGA